MGLAKTPCVRKYLCLMQALTKATLSRSSLCARLYQCSAYVFLALRFWQLGTEVVARALQEKGDFSQSPSDFVDVLATTAKTPRAMDKWVLRLDLTGQKGLNNTLKSLLVLADSCCTIE